LELQPDNAGALLGRARLNLFREDYQAARSDVDRVLQQKPGLGQAVLLKSLIASGEGNYAEAITILQSVLRSDPTNIELRLQVSALYVADERPRKAIRLLTQVLADDENSWRAMRARGDALLSVGKHAEAVEDYNRAMKIQPEDDGILNNLAWVLATSPMDDVRDGKRAVELALKACEVTEYKKPHILSTLGAAYAEAGDMENAIKWSSKAVELGETELKDQVEQLKDELKHYQEGKPFRELQNVEEKPDPPARIIET
jgi:tetratricopeptide (TPR) repeat protein